MKKTLVILLIILLVIFLVAGILALKTFVVGRVMPVSFLGYDNLSVTDEKVFFQPWLLSSAHVMSTYSYRVEDDVMYIKMKIVLVGVMSQSQVVDISGDFSTLRKIAVMDNEEERVWER